MSNIIHVVSAIINRDGGGTTLFLRRSAHNHHFVGYWQLPEGKVEPGESPEQALIRELREEIGCKPTTLHRIGQTTTEKVAEAPGITVVRTVYAVSIASQPHLDLEHDDLIWAKSPASLSPLYPGTAEAAALGTTQL